MNMAKALCEICKQETYRYICPKCEVVYCSLTCYKNHSQNCVEKFYKDQVEELLSSQRPTIEEQKKFEKLLWKLHNLDIQSDDEEVEEGSEKAESVEDNDGDDDRAEMLYELAEQGELDLKHLTDQELKQFHSAVKRGILEKHLETYTPWWITCVSEKGLYKKAHMCCCKNHIVNPNVMLTIIQTLYAYVFALRKTNGSWESDIATTELYLFTFCVYLFTKSSPEGSVLECLSEVTEKARNPPIFSRDILFNANCLLDISRILSFQDFAQRALSEIGFIIKRVGKVLVGEASTNSEGTVAIMQQALKKLRFLQSFVSYHWEMVKPVLSELDSFYRQCTVVTKTSQGVMGNPAMDLIDKEAYPLSRAANGPATVSSTMGGMEVTLGSLGDMPLSGKLLNIPMQRKSGKPPHSTNLITVLPTEPEKHS